MKLAFLALVLICVFRSEIGLARLSCEWYVAHPDERSLGAGIREITTLLRNRQHGFPEPSASKLSRAILGHPNENSDTFRRRVFAIRDLILHFANVREDLAALPASAFPFQLTPRAEVDKITLRELYTGMPQQPVAIETANSLTAVYETALSEAAVYIETGDERLFRWHRFLTYLVLADIMEPRARGELGVLSRTVISNEDLQFLYQQRNRFIKEPGEDPVLPGIPGNFTPAQFSSLRESLLSKGWDTSRVERLLQAPFFAGEYFTLDPELRMAESHRFEEDSVYLKALSILYSDGIKRGEKALRETEKSVGVPEGSLLVWARGDAGRVVEREAGGGNVMAGNMNVQLGLIEYSRRGEIVSLAEFFRRYLGDMDWYGGRRWEDLTAASLTAIQLLQFCAVWEDLLLRAKPKSLRIRELTPSDVERARTLYRRIETPEPMLKVADTVAVAEAEAHVSEILRSPSLGEAYRDLLERYLLLVRKLSVPHLYLFPEYVLQLRRTTKLLID